MGTKIIRFIAPSGELMSHEVQERMRVDGGALHLRAEGHTSLAALDHGAHVRGVALLPFTSVDDSFPIVRRFDVLAVSVVSQAESGARELDLLPVGA